MNNYCVNHPSKQTHKICWSCKNYYCLECLVEGAEYYYCKLEKCQNEYLNELKAHDIKVAEKTKKKSETNDNILSQIQNALNTRLYLLFIISFTISFLTNKMLPNKYDNYDIIINSFGGAFALMSLALIPTLIIVVIRNNKNIFVNVFTGSWIVVLIISLLAKILGY